MRRSILTVLVLFTVSFTSSAVHADWHSFWARVKLDFQRNNAFPDPFVGYDRIAARAPWKPMVAKGTQLQNTLGNHHFDVETHKLTAAGKAKLTAIMARRHVMRDTVFVLQGETRDVTAMRVASVRNTMTVVRPGRTLPAVLETDVPTSRWSAVRIQAIQQGALTAMPVPQLPQSAEGN